jgi:RNA-binding protein 26
VFVFLCFSRTQASCQAFANAPDIPSVGKVQVSWHTGAAPPTTPAVAMASSAVGSESSDVKTGVGESDVKMEVETRQGEHEDGGWGQAYDDEDEGRRRRSRSRSFS